MTEELPPDLDAYFLKAKDLMESPFEEDKRFMIEQMVRITRDELQIYEVALTGLFYSNFMDIIQNSENELQFF